MAPRPKFFVWNYEDLIKLTGMSMEALYQARSRGSFDPENLGSVVLFLGRHGTQEFRTQLVLEAIARDKEESSAVKEGRKKIKGVK